MKSAKKKVLKKKVRKIGVTTQCCENYCRDCRNILLKGTNEIPNIAYRNPERPGYKDFES